MASLTRAQLIEQLEASHVSYQRLEQECNELRRSNCELRTDNGQLSAELADRINARPTVRHAERPGNYAAACAAAREMARRTGRSVKVG